MLTVCDCLPFFLTLKHHLFNSQLGWACGCVPDDSQCDTKIQNETIDESGFNITTLVENEWLEVHFLIKISI
mgnify:CR=1 FL=1